MSLIKQDIYASYYMYGGNRGMGETMECGCPTRKWTQWFVKVDMG